MRLYLYRVQLCTIKQEFLEKRGEKVFRKIFRRRFSFRGREGEGRVGRRREKKIEFEDPGRESTLKF